jgi:hypothetical protein
MLKGRQPGSDGAGAALAGISLGLLCTDAIDVLRHLSPHPGCDLQSSLALI